jgi:hypothetical protein
MDALIDRLRQIIEAAFAGADIRLEIVESIMKVGGSVVWEGFSPYEQLERQERLWTALRHSLSDEEQFQVTAILTLTPTEVTGRAA